MSKNKKTDIDFVDKIFLDKIIKKEKPVHNNLVFTNIIVIVKKYLSFNQVIRLKVYFLII